MLKNKFKFLTSISMATILCGSIFTTPVFAESRTVPVTLESTTADLGDELTVSIPTELSFEYDSDYEGYVSTNHLSAQGRMASTEKVQIIAPSFVDLNDGGLGNLHVKTQESGTCPVFEWSADEAYTGITTPVVKDFSFNVPKTGIKYTGTYTGRALFVISMQTVTITPPVVPSGPTTSIYTIPLSEMTYEVDKNYKKLDIKNISAEAMNNSIVALNAGILDGTEYDGYAMCLTGPGAGASPFNGNESIEELSLLGDVYVNEGMTQTFANMPNLTSFSLLGSGETTWYSSCASSMFYNDPKLANVMISGIKLNRSGESPLSLSKTFSGCTSLRTLELPAFDFTGSDTSNLEEAFKGCTSLEIVIVNSTWSKENIDSATVFKDCVCKDADTLSK